MNAFKRLIEGNRQTGTSTALIKTVKEVGGYLIVSDQNRRHHILSVHPELKGNVFTYYDVEQGKCLGVEPGPLFFDTDCVWHLITKRENLEQKPNVVMLSEGMMADGYVQKADDGYTRNSRQINVKLTEDDVANVDTINRDFFENEASNSMMVRILLRKGIQFYKKLRDNF